MDQVVLEQMLSSGKMTSAEILARTPINQLDEALTMLMRHRPVKEVGNALMEWIARTPLEEFNAMKGVYFRHCVQRTT